MIDFVEGTFDIIKNVILLLYGVILFGLWRSAPHYLNKFLLFFNLFISCVLIILFNPLANNKFKPFHKRLAFSAGFAILMNSSLVNIIKPLEVIKVVKKVRFNV